MIQQAGQLAAYASPEAVAYDASLYSAQGYYHSTKLITTGIVYNTGAAEIPASWADLAKPEMANLTAMPSPLYSGAALIHLGAFTATIMSANVFMVIIPNQKKIVASLLRGEIPALLLPCWRHVEIGSVIGALLAAGTEAGGEHQA